MSKNLKLEQLVLLLTLHVLLFWTNNSLGYPRKRSLEDPPKWHNHCLSAPEQNGAYNNSSQNVTLSPNEQVKKAASFAYKRGKKIKQLFTDKIFNDKTFEDSTEMRKWLSRLPLNQDIKDQVFKDVSQAYQLAHEIIQIFAAGIEQLLSDQINKSVYMTNMVNMTQHFTDIKDDIYRILCELVTGMTFKSIEPRVYVQRDIVDEHKSKGEADSVRQLRDFIYLRDYVIFIDFIHQLFGQHEKKS